MKQFWANQSDDPYTLKKISEKDILKTEKKLGVKLPQEYKNLVLEQNGGYLECNAFPTDRPTSWAEDHIQFDHLLGIGKKEGILESDYLIKEWELPKDIILISGDGHSWVALDYRNTTENPPVHFFDLEMEEDFKLADSFNEFISKLYIDESDDSEPDLEGLDPDDYELTYISPDDPDAITKDEVNRIFEKNNEELFSNLKLFPIQNYDDLIWLLKKIETHTNSTNDVDGALELGLVLDTVATYKKNLILENKESLETFKNIISNLNRLNDSDVEIIINQLEDFIE
ncbi:SMI1/KNR4 family protein [Bacillus pumilus]|uniref:SMI1/KNR4 family protein n=1 Tax=Bacillus pumilus TaxID=1408 RepID=UPI00227F2A08|nr:SMI1/KNR4 family protein [Bacillus pumilus]MCY7572346.1 SMI1/KNR4 family protein [Bacillus pumilus]MCY7578273.1 SMI1/KNR4 family protein [Bacillus pumilus]MEC3761299.1 SMI1/KNR4 family protein [Bacillus pumilus]